MAMLVDLLDVAVGLWPEVADRLSKTSRDDNGVADINDTGYALSMQRTNEDFLSAFQKVAERRVAAPTEPNPGIDNKPSSATAD
jgi:hypothetical protein